MLGSVPMLVCLRLVVVVQCVGLGGRYLFSSLETESDVYGWLYFDCHWSESLAQSIDNAGALMTLVAGGIFCLAGWLMWKMPSESRWFNVVRKLDQAAAGWVAVWMLLIAAAHMMRAAVFAELSLPEHAVRYVAPLALAVGGGVSVASCVSPARIRLAVMMLTVAASFTFAAHGYKAYACYAPFIDLILLSEMQWTDIGFTQSTVEKMLVLIGVVDILVAAVLLIMRSRVAAFYMVVWGLVTAASRMTALGIEAWPETLIRIANGGVPLAILIHWTLNRK
ncbi:hypothetical protein [Rhodopirellula sp. P2]|uniref:hypothetical protein n=1 Tax=Rhodopirellula sp. P2 TaxID=2127060 RepID=UPI0023687C59|nr:hypothetical protein [Rhodopirellula sp. P2]WDQ16660.1 hypothetical protein PSR62_24030 [Rhodopirellula sp. P2]